MIEGYLVLAGRIRKELEDMKRVVARSQRAMDTARRNPQDADLYLDSAALNLHDAYSGFERLFKQIAATVEGMCLPPRSGKGTCSTRWVWNCRKSGRLC